METNRNKSIQKTKGKRENNKIKVSKTTKINKWTERIQERIVKLFIRPLNERRYGHSTRRKRNKTVGLLLY